MTDRVSPYLSNRFSFVEGGKGVSKTTVTPRGWIPCGLAQTKSIHFVFAAAGLAGRQLVLMGIRLRV